MAQGEPVYGEAHPVPVTTSKLMLVTCGDSGQLGAPWYFQTREPTEGTAPVALEN